MSLYDENTQVCAQENCQMKTVPNRMFCAEHLKEEGGLLSKLLGGFVSFFK